MNITNKNGVATTIDLSSAVTLRDVIDRINDSNAGVTASLNRSRTGLVIQDTTGGSSSNLKIENGDSQNTATKLQIASDTTANSVDSNSLGLQFVSEATLLSKLNQGRGVRLGSFTITDSTASKLGSILARSKQNRR